MKITKLELYTDKVQDLKIFYVMVLGFELHNETESDFTIKAGHTLLTFRWGNPTQASPSYHFAFNIPENKIEEARRWLYSRSVPLLKWEGEDVVDFPNWNAQALYFLDPADNIVELIARRDLANVSTVNFNAQSITSVSEIGLPVPEIEPFYQQLKVRFDLPLYSHIADLTKFCPTGDPEGLFIIVPLERAWFPTKLINGVHPLVVTIETAQEASTEDQPKEDQPKKDRQTEKTWIIEDLPYVIKEA